MLCGMPGKNGLKQSLRQVNRQAWAGKLIITLKPMKVSHLPGSVTVILEEQIPFGVDLHPRNVLWQTPLRPYYNTNEYAAWRLRHFQPASTLLPVQYPAGILKVLLIGTSSFENSSNNDVVPHT
jgi:hypothetical protein